MENRERQDAFEQRKNEKLLREIARLQDTAREKTQWAEGRRPGRSGSAPADRPDNYRSYQGAKAERTMARAKAIEKRREAALEEKKLLLKNLERREELKLVQLPFYAERLAELRNHPHRIWGADCLRFVRPFGAGRGADRTAGAERLRQKQYPSSAVRHGRPAWRRGPAWQRPAHFLCRAEHVGLCGSAAELIRKKEIDESRFYSILNKLDVPKAQLERDLRLLSEGQRKKVLLAASLCERAHLHVWDEPLNYIDVISRIQIEELLLRFRPTIVFVEHDKAFCEHVATRIVSMQKA